MEFSFLTLYSFSEYVISGFAQPFDLTIIFYKKKRIGGKVIKDTIPYNYNVTVKCMSLYFVKYITSKVFK
jgi:hypothetical protein